MSPESGTVIAVDFNANRRTISAQEQLQLLIRLVLEKDYGGNRYADMLGDFEHWHTAHPELKLKHWLQDRLGAYTVSRAIN